MSSAIPEIPNGSVTSPRGSTAAAAHAGLKTDGTPDVALLVSSTSCATAGVFTKNALRAAPVVYDADLLAERPGRMRAVAMNARVANACTGARSEEHTSELQSLAYLVCRLLLEKKKETQTRPQLTQAASYLPA